MHPISTDPWNRNSIDNLQLLCSECHLEKTTAQAFQNDYNPLLSYFNEHVWQNFVLSQRPNQQVYRSSKIDERCPFFARVRAPSKTGISATESASA